ncbi:MAG: zinc ABC transporter substrate-binding protein [Chloroflexota bacterium]
MSVSIAPQGYFVQRVGGERVTVNVLVPATADPHTFEPKPDQLRALSRSPAYITIGVEFEQAWLPRIQAANRKMLMVDGARGIERLPMAEDTDHADAPAGQAQDHDEELLDPHIWTSPRLAKIQTQTIAETLVQLDPAHRSEYEANLAVFQRDLDALDGRIRAALEGASSRKFLVFHPSWAYFAQEYGLEMIAVEMGGQEPSARELAAVIAMAKGAGIRAVFAQPELSTRSAETIAREIGGQVVLISPLAPDWLANMERVADAFAQALR